MPTYLTVPALQAILAAGRDDHTGTAASLPDEELASRIDAAEQVVDGQLARAGYTVPAATTDGTTPPLVAELTGAVAAYLADLQYRRNKAHENDSAPVLLRYQWATQLLEQIGERLIVVPGLVQDLAKRGEGAEAVAAFESYSGRMFGPDIADVWPRPVPTDWWY